MHMHTDTHTDASGFDLTAISGMSILELIIFAAICWCATLPAPAVIWCVCGG